MGGICAGKGDGGFVTTQWTEVRAAGQTTSTCSAAALERICRAYWYPLYVYVRRQGHDQEDARDLTQEFFARLLARKSLRLADRNRGSFRTFLLASLKHFLINEWTKAKRQKRGGECQFLSLDAAQTESRFLEEPADGGSPDKAYDRRWVVVLLDRVLHRLEREYDGARKKLVQELKPFLTGDEEQGGYAAVARRLGLTVGSVKVAAHRMRRRYKELLREEIASTLEDPGSVDDEIRELFAALNA